MGGEWGGGPGEKEKRGSTIHKGEGVIEVRTWQN